MKHQSFEGFGCEVYEKDGRTWISTLVDESIEAVIKYANLHRAQNHVCKLMTVNKWGSKIDYIDQSFEGAET